MSGAQARSNLLGAVFAFLAALCFSVNDVLIKFLSDGYALHEVVLIRSVVALSTFALVVLPFQGLVVLRTRIPMIHVIRGLCVVFANTFLFLGLAALPIADAVAIFFVSPLIITVFSVVFLREKVGTYRWVAVAVGLVGVLLIMRPGTSAYQLASIFPVLAATLYATLHIITRKIGGTESAATMTFYSQLTFFVVSGVIGLSIGNGVLHGAVHPDLDFLVRPWIGVEPGDFWLLGLLGVTALFGVLFISQAYRLSEAAFAAPFEYVSMPLAILWGVTVFGTWPDAIAWGGIALILGSGLYLVWRETRKGRAVASKKPLRR